MAKAMAQPRGGLSPEQKAKVEQSVLGAGTVLTYANLIAKAFCNHPLISCLSKGSDGKPSYIAPRANVDTLHIIGALSTDPNLRSATANSAIEYLRTQSGASQSLSGSTEHQLASQSPAPIATLAQGPNPEVSSQSASTAGTPAASPGTQPAPAQSLEKAATDLASLEVPLGWADPEHTYFRRHWWSALLGWLITALAASMGAPFWFDALNRCINIRAAGRAPDETPKGVVSPNPRKFGHPNSSPATMASRSMAERSRW
jgi:hypothetical protein